MTLPPACPRLLNVLHATQRRTPRPAVGAATPPTSATPSSNARTRSYLVYDTAQRCPAKLLAATLTATLTASAPHPHPPKKLPALIMSPCVPVLRVNVQTPEEEQEGADRTAEEAQVPAAEEVAVTGEHWYHTDFWDGAEDDDTAPEDVQDELATALSPTIGRAIGESYGLCYLPDIMSYMLPLLLMTTCPRRGDVTSEIVARLTCDAALIKGTFVLEQHVVSAIVQARTSLTLPSPPLPSPLLHPSFTNGACVWPDSGLEPRAPPRHRSPLIATDRH